MQRLEDLDVEVVGEGGVAADAEDGDGAPCEVELGDRLQGVRMAMGSPQPGQRWWAPTSMSVGREVVDQPGGLGGGGSVGSATYSHSALPPAAQESRPDRSTATSRSGAMPNPELSRLRPPMKSTGAAPEHGEAHVVDHLALVVLVDRDRPGAPAAAGHSCRSGRGTG